MFLTTRRIHLQHEIWVIVLRSLGFGSQTFEILTDASVPWVIIAVVSSRCIPKGQIQFVGTLNLACTVVFLFLNCQHLKMEIFAWFGFLAFLRKIWKIDLLVVSGFLHCCFTWRRVEESQKDMLSFSWRLSLFIEILLWVSVLQVFMTLGTTRKFACHSFTC